MNTEEILKRILNHFILACELDMVIREKNIAVRNQSFELAVKWRDEENRLRGEMLPFEDLKSLRDQLNQQQPVTQ
jgi:hypothetical protein